MVQLMGLDPESQWPLYVAAVGRVNRDF